MKKIKLLIVIGLLSSCATSNETRWIQRIQKEGDLNFAIGPVVEIKLTRRQLNKIRNSEYLINVKDLQGGHQYPQRVILLEKTGLDIPIFVGPYTPTLKK
jgi:hypothetical protein